MAIVTGLENAVAALEHNTSVTTITLGRNRIGDQGAARIEIKSVDALQADATAARENAQAADKGKQTHNA